MSVGNIIFYCWIIFLVYWTASAHSIKPVQEIKKVPHEMWWSISGRVILAVLLLLPFGQLFAVSYFLSILSIILVIGGLVIAVMARIILAENWDHQVVIKQKHELITQGIYGYIRHPIYTGVLCMVLGTVLYRETVGSLIAFLICVIFLAYKMKQEELLLTKYFPREYSAYKLRVKALIPFIV